MLMRRSARPHGRPPGEPPATACLCCRQMAAAGRSTLAMQTQAARLRSARRSLRIGSATVSAELEGQLFACTAGIAAGLKESGPRVSDSDMPMVRPNYGPQINRSKENDFTPPPIVLLEPLCTSAGTALALSGRRLQEGARVLLAFSNRTAPSGQLCALFVLPADHDVPLALQSGCGQHVDA